MESQSKALKEIIRRKDLVIQKASKGTIVVISDPENYLHFKIDFSLELTIKLKT